MKKEKVICDNCFYRDTYEDEVYCRLIEDEDGGNIGANQNKCDYYLKRGQEPKWPCRVCGVNTYGTAHSSDYRGSICGDCEFKEEEQERKLRAQKKRLENVKKVSEILGGDKKTAERIVDVLQ